MNWQGLLTDKQHHLGYGTTIDEDFVCLWHGKNSDAKLVAIFLYEIATIKEVRQACQDNEFCLAPIK